MKPAKLSLSQARRLALSAQGLYGKPASDGLSALERLGYAQIDTISVVERAHHHALWSRSKRYEPEQLEAWVRGKKVFEYWWHAAAYLPMKDFRFYLPRMRALAEGEHHWFQSARDEKIMRFVLDRIRAEGALKSSDFERPEDRSGPWWGWKPAKIALERLFQEGRLMIARREGFQKVYDLPERVLPPGLDAGVPTSEEWGRWLVLRHLDAHGLAGEREISYLRKERERSAVREALKRLAGSGEIRAVAVDGVEGSFFARPQALEKIPREAARRLFVLSPFDNAVIQRSRLKKLFGFEYQIECYLPAAKRKFGYFACPLLWGDGFVGRLDAKAERKDKRLVVKSLWLEKAAGKKGPARAEGLPAALAAELRRFAAFNGCEEISLADCPARLKAGLKRALQAAPISA